MKIFKLSLLVAPFLLIGCGEYSDNYENNPTHNGEVSSPKTVKEAENNFKAIGAFESIDISSVNVQNKLVHSMKTSMGHMAKIENSYSSNCADGGTIKVTIDKKDTTIVYNSCKVGAKYTDGTISIHEESKNNSTIKISKFTTRDVGGEQYMDMTFSENENNDITTTKIDGKVNKKSTTNEISNMSFSNFVAVDKEGYDESWSTVNGNVSIESKCVTGNYKFKTVEKLVEAKDGTDNVESGILDINGATYTFANPYVTIKATSEERTILQSKLEKEMESNNCTGS